MKKKIGILGSTGSIGENTVKIIQNNKAISTKNILFLPYKDLKIQPPSLSFEIEYFKKGNQLKVKVLSQNFVKGVYLSSFGAINFSDNYFDLPSKTEKIVTINLDESVNPEQVVKAIKLRSLWDNFN